MFNSLCIEVASILRSAPLHPKSLNIRMMLMNVRMTSHKTDLALLKSRAFENQNKQHHPPQPADGRVYL